MHLRAVGGVTAALVAVACYAVSPIDAPRAYIEGQAPAQVWLVTQDDSMVSFERPQLLGDTLAGFVNDAYREVSLSEVREVRIRQFAVGRTAGLAVVVVAAVGASALLVRRRRPGASAGAASA